MTGRSVLWLFGKCVSTHLLARNSLDSRCRTCWRLLSIDLCGICMCSCIETLKSRYVVHKHHIVEHIMNELNSDYSLDLVVSSFRHCFYLFKHMILVLVCITTRFRVNIFSLMCWIVESGDSWQHVLRFACWNHCVPGYLFTVLSDAADRSVTCCLQCDRRVSRFTSPTCKCGIWLRKLCTVIVRLILTCHIYFHYTFFLLVAIFMVVI